MPAAFPAHSWAGNRSPTPSDDEPCQSFLHIVRGLAGSDQRGHRRGAGGGRILAARPLEAVYPLIFFDALRIKVRDEGLVRNKAVHIALGVRADGTKEILGLWLEQNEGAKFWLRVMNELKNRGVEDVLIAVVDGLKGFPEV